MTPELASPSPNFRATCWRRGSILASPLQSLHPSWVGLTNVAIFAPHQR
ncbi:hypothetical protein AVEN_105766-1, partial [Araneus ventricosus]